jgi:hypothetical protein
VTAPRVPGLELLYQIQFLPACRSGAHNGRPGPSACCGRKIPPGCRYPGHPGGGAQGHDRRADPLHAATLAFRAGRAALAETLLRRNIDLQAPLADRALYLLGHHYKYTLGKKTGGRPALPAGY